MKKLIVILFSIFFVCSSFAEGKQTFAFEEPEYRVIINNTLKLSPVAQGISGKLQFSWESSDESIATVKNGIVKGLKFGSVTITCNAVDKNNQPFSASCVVYVIVPVSKVTVEEKKVEVPSGDYYKLTVTVEPENATVKKLVWSSSNEKVIKVTPDGRFFGVQPGKATLTGKTTDGSNKKVTITVTVPKVYTTHDKMTLSDHEGIDFGYAFSGSGFMSMGTRGDCFTLESVKDKNGFDSFSYSPVNYIKVLPVKAGSGSIIFTVNGRTAKTVKVKVEHSAVYDKVSYPSLSLKKILSDKNAYLESQTHFSGTVYNTVLTGVRSGDGLTHPGIVYVKTTENNTSYFFAFEYEKAHMIHEGDSCVVYGSINRFEQFTTETGLVYDCPVLTAGKVEKSK